MPEARILSAGPAVGQGPVALLLFDACEVGIVLRAVLGVELVLAVGLMYGGAPWADWAERLAFATAGALPATLFWLLACCGLKHWLARWPLRVQMAFGVVLGAVAGLFAMALLASVDMALQPAWLAGASTGALFASGLVFGLRWRARARQPAKVAARLAELQARIRPHFLFNTLNMAIALVRDDPARAERVLEDLADLFRHALVDHDQRSSVARELALARGYLEIEQLRFGDRLRLHWSLDARAEAAALPVLILQPLVENAVRHGVEPSEAGADVWVSTRLRGGGTVEIEVRNTLPAGHGRSGHGLALDNVRERLHLLYDMEARLLLHATDSVYIARMRIPLRGGHLK